MLKYFWKTYKTIRIFGLVSNATHSNLHLSPYSCNYSIALPVVTLISIVVSCVPILLLQLLSVQEWYIRNP
jgi:hypothetical protein